MIFIVIIIIFMINFIFIITMVYYYEIDEKFDEVFRQYKQY